VSDARGLTVDLDRSVVTLGGRRLVLHCHHYNVFLQRTIEDGLKERAPLLLTAAAVEASRSTLGALSAASPAAAVIAEAARILSTNGFGHADVSELHQRGGRAILSPSHYALGWVSKWGMRTKPCCFFPAGWLGGAVVVAGGYAPERVSAREVACVATGAERCEFVVEVW
jgi:hypothetical protein